MLHIVAVHTDSGNHGFGGFVQRFLRHIRWRTEMLNQEQEMLDRHQLETFATVADAQSFERAAAILNISRGAVSQRIKALEESLAAVLLIREKPVVPTPAGEILLRHVKALRLMEGTTLDALKPRSGTHVPLPLAIAVNADSLATWFPRVLWELLMRRQVALEIVTDDQDHTSSRLARGEVIGCVSTESRPAKGFVAECLGAMEYRCYATPVFAADHFSTGLNVRAVLAAPAILFDRKDSLHDDFLKRKFGFAVDRYPRHYLPSPILLMEGVAAGVGYGLVPRLQATSLAMRGEFVDLAPDQPMLVNLHWHHWELEPHISREITNLVVGHAQELLLPREKEDSTQATSTD